MGGSTARDRRRVQQRMRPALTALEERRLLSTFTVTKTTDDGSEGTLRWALDQSNGATEASTVNFDPAVFNSMYQVIVLAQGRGDYLELGNTRWPQTIVGPPNNVRITGHYAVNHNFWVDEGANASISNLDIAEAEDLSAENGGGGMNNQGTVHLTNCNFIGNVAYW